MKRILLITILLIFSFVGCSANASEEAIDLTELPYYSYLNETNPVVTITVKNEGIMKLQLFPNVANNTVNNFINYIEDGSYSGSSFHRIIEDFMIQGGKVTSTNCAIKGEFSSNGVINNLSHERGVISMARTFENNSATSQFFIVHKDSQGLDDYYAGFGGLISGFNVLDELATVSTNSQDAPLETVIIESINVELNGYVVEEVDCAN